jgi:hypothetical protein
VNVVMQGMRRSGTTIAFDGFWEDGRFRCFYEPLAATRPTSGGGSGAHGDDLFGPVREARAVFLADNPDVQYEQLNHGAPREPSLELEQDAPDYIIEYIQHLLRAPGPVVAKFTRLARKVPIVHRIDPGALFVHLVRDPRAVTASHLFGRDGMHRDRFKSDHAFFTRRSRSSTWSSRPLSKAVRRLPEYSHLSRRLPDFAQLLLLWTHHVRSTHADASRLYGDRYLIVRHEDLAHDPVRELHRIYDAISIEMPEHVRSWLGGNVRPPKPPHAHAHPAWREWAERIGMAPELDAMGYDISR